MGTDRIAALDGLVASHDLNSHPFYEAWRKGTLPVATLADYAADYGMFIASLSDAWETLGEKKYAAEERAHTRMWERFQGALETEVRTPCREVQDLLGTSRELFASPAGALGALYAFEAQQPNTTRSKLQGLRTHYRLASSAEHYFAAHADDVRERDDLAARIDALPEAEYAAAHAACERMSRALYRALDGFQPVC
jgi:pyrroloquinoline-quinone synthase